MRAYLATTASLFALLTVAHLWRMFAEPRLAQDPWFLLVTAIAVAFGLWALRLLRLDNHRRNP